MARRYDSKEAKRRILTACVRLFLEKGYTNTKVAEILKEADVSAGSFQNIFRTKDGVLTELIGMMFSRQFGAVRPLAANAPSPVYLYAVETALQLALSELSENCGISMWKRTPSPPRRRSSTAAPRPSCRRRSARICPGAPSVISTRWSWARLA